MFGYEFGNRWKSTKLDTFNQRLDILVSTSSVIAGVGELDLNTSGTISPPITPVHQPSSCPYLLLDVRTREEFDQCHIISGEFML